MTLIKLYLQGSNILSISSYWAITFVNSSFSAPILPVTSQLGSPLEVSTLKSQATAALPTVLLEPNTPGQKKQSYFSFWK